MRSTEITVSMKIETGVHKNRVRLSSWQRRILLSSRHASRSNYIIKRLAPREFHFSMDAVEIVTRQLEVFEKSSVIYLNCVDLAVDIRQSSEILHL